MKDERKKGAMCSRGFRLAAAIGLSIVALSLGCSDDDRKVVRAAEEDPPDSLAGANITEFHASFSATDSDNNQCIECHGDMTDRVTLSDTILPFHERHEQITPDHRCVDCHTSVDLLEGSGATLRKQVDAEAVCSPCHGPGSIKPLYQS